MIIVEVRNGLVVSVTGLAPGEQLQVRDYDAPLNGEPEDGAISKDEDGEEYAAETYTGE